MNKQEQERHDRMIHAFLDQPVSEGSPMASEPLTPKSENKYHHAFHEEHGEWCDPDCPFDYATRLAGAEAELLALRPVVEAARRFVEVAESYRDLTAPGPEYLALRSLIQALSGQAEDPEEFVRKLFAGRADAAKADPPEPVE